MNHFDLYFELNPIGNRKSDTSWFFDILKFLSQKLFRIFNYWTPKVLLPLPHVPPSRLHLFPVSVLFCVTGINRRCFVCNSPLVSICFLFSFSIISSRKRKGESEINSPNNFSLEFFLVDTNGVLPLQRLWTGRRLLFSSILLLSAEILFFSFPFFIHLKIEGKWVQSHD